MRDLTKEDYSEIMGAIGGDSEESFKDVNEFVKWINENRVSGDDLKAIGDCLNKKFGTNVLFFNKKERLQAKPNAIKRISDFLLENDVAEVKEPAKPKESEKTEAVQSKISETKATETVKTVEKTSSEKEKLNIDYSKLMNEIGFVLSKNPVFEEDKTIDCTGDNIHFVGEAITAEDEIGLVDFNSDIYSDLLTAVVSKENKVMGAGKLKKCGNEYRIIIGTDAILNESWGNNVQFKVLLFPKSVETVLKSGNYTLDDSIISQIKYVSIKITERERPESESPLCIDFGTSNTTAGYFVNDADDSKRFVNVQFENSLDDGKYVQSDIIPTLIYVKHCEKDSSKNTYLFGYDAKKALIEHDYIPDASIFFEIKRWFGIDSDKSVNITDEDGNESEIKYFELVKAYLLHIIEKTEIYSKCKFKRIHFTSPVKLKTKFLNQFKKMFKGRFEVVDGNFLDEGTAVIYETIRNNIRDKENHFKDANMMVIDCGGGTTDVASCRISREKNNDIENLVIRTEFVDGESNFGGNNITYRIMQLVKIKLANFYWDEMNAGRDGYTTSVRDLLPLPEEVLGYIDEDYKASQNNDKCGNGYKIVYKKLEEEYAEAEKLIPTKFEDDNELTKYAKKKNLIKRNFYYLWNLAEIIKTEFYKKDRLTFIGFTDSSDKAVGENYENILNEHSMDFSIYICSDEKTLVEKDVQPKITITAQEVNDLIRGDIYNLLSRIFHDDQNTDYEFYRFSGQSCKIRLFNELMKEFIAGKKLRKVVRKKAVTDDKNTEELKTSCVRGVVYYEYDTKFGNIKPRIENNPAKISYSVWTEFNDNKVQIINKDEIHPISIADNTEHINLKIKNIFGEEINYITVNLSAENAKTINTEQIGQMIDDQSYKQYKQQVIDELSNKEDGRYFLVFPNKFGSELIALTIKKEMNNGESIYSRSEPVTKCVDNASQTFFDGNK